MRDGGRRPAGLRARLPAAAGSRRPRVDRGARLSRRAERAPGGGRADRSGARSTPKGWTSSRAPARAGDARLVYVTPSHQYPLGVPMSLPRRLALLSWARAARAWVIEDDYDSEFRYGARPDPVPARSRRRRARDLRRQLQQDALSGAAPGLPHRADGPSGAAGRGAGRRGPAPADARPGRPGRLHRRGALRPPPAADARGVPGAAGRADRGGGAVSAAARCACGRCRPGSTRSPISTASTRPASSREAAARGVEVAPLSAYFAERPRPAPGPRPRLRRRPSRCGEARHGAPRAGHRGGPSSLTRAGCRKGGPSRLPGAPVPRTLPLPVAAVDRGALPSGLHEARPLRSRRRARSRGSSTPTGILRDLSRVVPDITPAMLAPGRARAAPRV